MADEKTNNPTATPAENPSPAPTQAEAKVVVQKETQEALAAANRAQIISELRIAATNNPKYRAILADEGKLNLTLALIQRLQDGTLQIIPPGAVATIATLKGEEVLRRTQELERIKGDASTLARGFVAQLDESAKVLKDARELETKYSGNVLTTTGQVQVLQKVLERTSTLEQQTERMNVLTDIAALVCSMTSEKKTQRELKEAIARAIPLGTDLAHFDFPGKEIQLAIAGIIPIADWKKLEIAGFEIVTKNLSNGNQKWRLSILKSLPSLLSSDEKALTIADQTNILKKLEELGRLRNFTDNERADIQKLSEALTTKIVELEAKNLEVTSAAEQPRRIFNLNVVGDDAQSIVDMAVIKVGDQWYIDFEVLEKILDGLPKDDKKISYDKNELRKIVCPDEKDDIKLTQIDGPKWKDRKAALVQYLKNQGVYHEWGESLSAVNAKANERLLLQKWARDQISLAKTDDKLNFNKLAGALNAKFSTSIKDADIQRESEGLKNDTAAPKDWSDATLVAFIVKKARESMPEPDGIQIDSACDIITPKTNPVFGDIRKILKDGFGDITDTDFAAFGLKEGQPVPERWNEPSFRKFLAAKWRLKQVKKIAGTLQVDATWKERAMAYGAETGNGAASGAGKWWRWIKSLPDVIYNKDLNEKQLPLLEQIQALEKVKNTIETMMKADAMGDDKEKKEKSPLAGVFDDIVKLQQQMDDLDKPVGAAAAVKERVKQYKDLLRATDFTFEQLKKTNYSQLPEKDRATAFYIAMQQGLDPARTYANTTDADLRLRDEPNGSEAFRGNVLKNKELGGRDILQPLKNIGLKVHKGARDVLNYTLVGDPPDQHPLAVGDTRIDNWLTEPAKAGPALEKILLDDPSFMGSADKKVDVGIFVRVFTTKTDDPKLSVADANRMVGLIRDHLLKQAEDQTTSYLQNAAKERFNSPLNVIYAGSDAVKKMFNSNDPVKKVLACTLVGGALYAIYKGWERGGLTKFAVWAVPMTFGLDIALKEASGKGVFERFGLTFMNERDRTSSREQLLRKSGKLKGYEFMDSDLGHEAVKQLTDPGNPVSVEELLAWRDNIGTRENWMNGAPKQLNPGPVMNRMGMIANRTESRDSRTNEAYGYMFRAFEAMCIDIAKSNGLDGTSDTDLANKGAELIRKRYVTFTEEGFGGEWVEEYQQAAANEPGKKFSLLAVYVRERPTPAMRDALENSTVLEWFSAYIGAPLSWVTYWWGEGKNFAELQALWAKEGVPPILKSAQKGALATYESFMKSFIPAKDRAMREGKEDFMAAYKSTLQFFSDLKIGVINHGPESIEFVAEKGFDAASFVGDKAVEFWYWLYRHHFTGPAIRGAGDFIATCKDATKPAELKDVADDAKAAEELRACLEPLSKISPTKEKIRGFLQTFIGDKKTPSEKAIALELCKREIFSCVLAYRMEQINNGMDDDTYTQVKPLEIPWTDLKIVNNKFIDFNDPNIQRTYEYIRSHYDGKHVLGFMGNQKQLPGRLVQYASGDSVGAWIASPFAAVAGVITNTDAEKYMSHDIAAYRAAMLSGAEDSVGPKDSPAYKEYEAYVDTLLINVAMESALAPDVTNPNVFRDAMMTEERAKLFRQNLITTRGNVPMEGPVRAAIKGSEDFYIESKPELSPVMKAVANDPVGKELLQEGKVSRAAPAPETTEATTPTGVAKGPKKKAEEKKPEVVNDAINKFKGLKQIAEGVAALKGLSDLITSNPKDAQKIRKTVDDFVEKTKNDLPNVSVDEILPFLRSVSDGKVGNIEEVALKKITKPDDLDALIQERANLSGDDQVKVQQLMDKGIRKLLGKDVTEGILKRFKDGADTDMTLEADVQKLYRATSVAKDDKLTNVVSALLEYMAFKGKNTVQDPQYENKRGYEKYQAYLKTNNLPEPQKPTRGGWSWRGALEWAGDKAGYFGDLPKERFAKNFNKNATVKLANDLLQKLDK